MTMPTAALTPDMPVDLGAAALTLGLCGVCFGFVGVSVAGQPTRQGKSDRKGVGTVLPVVALPFMSKTSDWTLRPGPGFALGFRGLSTSVILIRYKIWSVVGLAKKGVQGGESGNGRSLHMHNTIGDHDVWVLDSA